MTMDVPRPVLSAEERAALQASAAPLRAAKKILADLHEIGFDTAAEQEWADQQERLRAGLLAKFSRGQVTRERP